MTGKHVRQITGGQRPGHKEKDKQPRSMHVDGNPEHLPDFPVWALHGVTVAATKMERQLSWIRAIGYTAPMHWKDWWRGVSVIFGLAVTLHAHQAEAQVTKAGPASCPAVALTYDLCPVRTGSGFDRELIDFLIEHKVPATFFMSGRWMTKHDAEVKTLLAVPFFEIGTHGEVHAHLPMHEFEEQQQEIMGPVRLLKSKYGRPATLFRPPYGEYNDVTVEAVKALSLRFILWNIESGDPDPTLSAEAILTRVQKRIKPGSVIVFHANGKGNHTREVTEALAGSLLADKGLTAMTVSDLLRCNQSTTAPKP